MKKIIIVSLLFCFFASPCGDDSFFNSAPGFYNSGTDGLVRFPTVETMAGDGDYFPPQP